MHPVMSHIELFTLFYYYLEAYNQAAQNDEIKHYLTYADPFFFTDLGSADKRYFMEFDLMIGPDPIIEADYGYYRVMKYVNKKGMAELIEAFSKISYQEWMQTARLYLSRPHKGGQVS